MWRYRIPLREDFSTEEEYNEALAWYESAMDMYEEECIEAYFESKYN